MRHAELRNPGCELGFSARPLWSFSIPIDRRVAQQSGTDCWPLRWRVWHRLDMIKAYLQEKSLCVCVCIRCEWPWLTLTLGGSKNVWMEQRWRREADWKKTENKVDTLAAHGGTLDLLSPPCSGLINLMWGLRSNSLPRAAEEVFMKYLSDSLHRPSVISYKEAKILKTLEKKQLLWLWCEQSGFAPSVRHYS